MKSFLLIVLPIFLFPLNVHATSPMKGRTVVIDPGHGTINPFGRIINAGKETRNAVPEHRLTMAISKKLSALLKSEGAQVYLTRTSQDYWRENMSAPEDNKSRAIFANEVGADVYLSIHCDWYPNRNLNGVSTHYYKKQSRRLAYTIQNQLVKTLGATDRKLVHDSYTVLDHTTMPAVIIETGFMSHQREAKKLQTSDYQQKIALGIARALHIYFSK